MKISVSSRLRVENSDTGFVLFDQSIEPISADEARGLLVGEKGTLPKVFLLAASVTLEHGGCLQLLAVVKPEGSQTPIYSGQAVVPVR